MTKEEYQKFFCPQYEYTGSKTALIKNIRKRKNYTWKQLRERNGQLRSRQELFNIYQKTK